MIGQICPIRRIGRINGSTFGATFYDLVELVSPALQMMRVL